ncbi:serine hydrolase, partial [Pseudomonas parafulva]
MKICHQLAGLLLAGLVGLSPAVLAQTPPKVKAAAAATAQRLASNHALVVDLKTNQVLFAQNPDQVAPIASVTKLMTAMVVLDAKQPLDQVIDIDISENPAMRGVFSRVRLGSELTRRDMLQLALMSSENRAATSLAYHYPGGQKAFVAAMNAKARALGMKNTR